MFYLFRNQAVPPMNQLLMALRFYATGCMLITAGDFGGVHKSTACRIIHRVTRAIARLHRRYIILPETPEQLQRTQEKFYRIARFPRVVGALDCTHVAIRSPGGDHAEDFRNRKSYFSYNVQTLCNADLQITDIVARWPGSCHDSYIFNNSSLCGRFGTGRLGNGLIVADSAYGVRNYLMPPLRQTHTRAEELYNESLIRSRNVVERTYGIWKRRFPILALGIRVNRRNVEAIIVATAVLHNIARSQNEDLPPEEAHIIQQIDFNRGNMNQGNDHDHQGGGRARALLVNDYFANL